MNNEEPGFQLLSASHRLLITIALMVFSFIFWSMNSEIAITSRTTGEVVPMTEVKRVEHLEGGIIAEIRVAEGDVVTVGQPMLMLDDTRDHASVSELESQFRTLEIRQIRFQAEIAGEQTLHYRDELVAEAADLINNQKMLFLARGRRLQGQIASQQLVLKQRQQEVEETQARIATGKDVIRYVAEQIEISDKLMESELSTRMVHVDLLKRQAELKGQLVADRAMLERLKSGMEEAENRVALIQNTFHEEVEDAFGKLLAEQKDLQQRLLKARDRLKRTVIRSPAEGIVKTVYVAAAGEVISPGEVVAEIVPLEDRLMVNAQLPTTEVGYISRGQRVEVRLPDVVGHHFGAINGQVIQVSPDTLLTKDGVPFYKVQINLMQQSFRLGEKVFKVVPGMVLQCDIVTGSRTVWDALFAPFFVSLDTALHER